MTNDDITRWKQQVREISDWLYELDPVGAAADGEAPRDEYDGEATRILSGIQNAISPSECREVIQDVFDKFFGDPWAPPEGSVEWLLTFSKDAR